MKIDLNYLIEKYSLRLVEVVAAKVNFDEDVESELKRKFTTEITMAFGDAFLEARRADKG